MSKSNSVTLKLSILTVLCVLFAIFEVAWSFLDAYKVKSYSETFLSQQQKLGRLIKTHGIKIAYAYFKIHFNDFDPNGRHYLGHFMGEEAYKLLKDKGFSICDFGLDYGCIHGYVIAGINDQGTDFFNTVMARCKAIDAVGPTRDSCIHGVSHTILSFRGYTVPDLNSSLKECDKLLGGDIFSGLNDCYSAVFMEFNLRSLDGSETGDWFTVRSLDLKNPTYPCGNLDSKYQWNCFSELGSYWANNLGDKFDEMGKFCSTALPGNQAQGCFWGLGRTMSDLYNYDIEKIGPECQKITTASTLYSCINGASIILYNNNAPHASDICNFAGVDKSKCREYFSQRGYSF